MANMTAEKRVHNFSKKIRREEPTWEIQATQKYNIKTDLKY